MFSINKKLISFPLITLLFYVSFGQIQFHRQYLYFWNCLNFPVITGFNITAYMGDWYEVQKFSTVFDIGTSCVSTHYSNVPNGNGSFLVQNSHLTLTKPKFIEGKAIPIGLTPGVGKFSIKFPGDESTPYWILATDYTTYSLVWSCKNAGPYLNFQIVWILSRTRKLPFSSLAAAYNKLRNLGIRTWFLQKTWQTGCPKIRRMKKNENENEIEVD